MSESSVRVYVPQQFNVSLEDAPESIGVGLGKESLVTPRWLLTTEMQMTILPLDLV